jgi:hypothetical protein
MLQNRRFLGAWELVSFESRAADGAVTRPWGSDPFGIIIWDDTGHMSAQLGPRDPGAGAYIAYCGTLDAEDVTEGTLVHHVLAASAERLRADQVRAYRFSGSDELVLSPPASPEGAVSTLRWRRYR